MVWQLMGVMAIEGQQGEDKACSMFWSGKQWRGQSNGCKLSLLGSTGWFSVLHLFDPLISGVFFAVGVLSTGRGGSITLSTLSFSTSLRICSTQNYFSSARSRTRMRLSRAEARQRQRLSLGQLERLLDVSYNPSNSLSLKSGKHSGMKIDNWKHNLDYIEPSFDLKEK